MTLRALLAPLLLIVASPVAAQTAVEEARDMIISQNIEAGFDQSVSEQLADCFASVMSEDEAEVILASEAGTPQQIATGEMQNYDEALACVLVVLE